jgi:hypothetical protein
MATTTNYGWTTPDDTALVKDGASAIRSLGTSVDTTTKNLNPSTTLGDIEYRSSTANVNTRLPLGTAGQVLKVNSGATAPEWATDASGMTNPMTTTGDTIYSSSGSTPARLGIGTSGQVLTVSGGGVPSWATPAGGAGLTLIDATAFTSVGSVAKNSVFTSTYENYRIILKLDSVSTAMAVKFNFRVGGSSNTTSNYNYAAYKNSFTALSLVAYDYGASTTYFYIGEAVSAFTGSYDVISPQSSTKKFINGLAVQSAAGYSHQGFFNATTSFDGFEITLSSGTISGTVYTYGYAK